MNQVIENLLASALVITFSAWSLWVAQKGSWQGRMVSSRFRRFLAVFGILCAAFALFLVLLTFGMIPLP